MTRKREPSVDIVAARNASMHMTMKRSGIAMKFESYIAATDVMSTLLAVGDVPGR
ncbi:MAG: hypothetical protein WCY70_06470 [Methanoculleus sp.]